VKYNQPFGVSDPNAVYINGNPATGTQGSIPPAASIEYDQREIVEVIAKANQRGYHDFDSVPCAVPDNADLAQLRKAIEGNTRYWIEIGGGFLTEAPTDGKLYGRINATWGACPPEAPADSNYYVRYNNTWVIGPVSEAPQDGNYYSRHNATWAVPPAGLPEAPLDGAIYGRRNATWVAIVVGTSGGNQPPTITSNGGGPTASVSVASNATSVTTVTATDPDVSQTISYSIIGGANASMFAIGTWSGVLTFAGGGGGGGLRADDVAVAPYVAPGTYHVIVQASDGFGGTDSQDIAVTVSFVNTPPTITSPTSISSVAGSTNIWTLTADDPDVAGMGQVLTWSIIGGADASLVTLSTAGVLDWVTPPPAPYPSPNRFVNVQVSDGAGGTDTANMTVWADVPRLAASDVPTCFGVQHLKHGQVDLAQWDAISPTGRHYLAHQFVEETLSDFDPRDPEQYIARLLRDEVLPGMPSIDEWKKSSLDELHNRLSLAVELLASAFVGQAAKVRVLEGQVASLTALNDAIMTRLEKLERGTAVI
jgi:hypothetical protein